MVNKWEMVSILLLKQKRDMLAVTRRAPFFRGLCSNNIGLTSKQNCIVKEYCVG